MTAELVIMARQPVAGKVKTRLAASIGDQLAALVAEALMRQTLSAVKQYWHGKIVLSVTPDCHHELIQELCETHQLYCHKQCEGDLGQRMYHELDGAITRHGYGVVIGIDAPHAMKRALPIAWQAAQQQKAVIGPSEDGGYYLVGLPEARDELFRNMSWGSDQVYTTTVSRLQDVTDDFLLCPLATDIDTLEDLQKVAAGYTPLLQFI